MRIRSIDLLHQVPVHVGLAVVAVFLAPALVVVAVVSFSFSVLENELENELMD